MGWPPDARVAPISSAFDMSRRCCVSCESPALTGTKLPASIFTFPAPTPDAPFPYGNDFATVTGVSARLERARRQRDRERVVAGDVEGRHARRAAQELQEQSAVLGRDPAGAELGIGARRPVDVRHVERVAADRDAGKRALRARDL